MNVNEKNPIIRRILQAFNKNYKAVLLKELKKASKSRIEVLSEICAFYKISKDLRLRGQSKGSQLKGVAFPMLISFFEAYATQRNPNKDGKKEMMSLIGKYCTPQEKGKLLSSISYNKKFKGGKWRNPSSLNEFFEILYQIRCDFIHQAFLAAVPQGNIYSFYSLLHFPRKKTRTKTTRRWLLKLSARIEDLQDIIEKIVIRDLNRKRSNNVYPV